jgi:uncharacterized protein YndB with AHSA1/START domain
MSQNRSPVVIERTYRAEVEELWALWTTKEGFESWWGPEGFHVEVHVLEARVGGRLNYEMIAHAPEQVAALKTLGRPPSHGVHARFSELKSYERLVITNTIDFLPEVEAYETTIAVDFIQIGSNTRMVVTMKPMHNEEFTRMSKMGFTSQLTKLDKRFAQAGA